jgi:hypothetical protein
MASFEASLTLPAPSRSVAARRGRVTQSKIKAAGRQRRLASDSGDSDIDPTLLDPAAGAADESSVDTDTDVTDCEPLDNVNLTPAERTATQVRVTPSSYVQFHVLIEIQKYVTQAFRRYCHVSGKDWPDPSVIRTNPITHETYPAPYFDFDVTDARNDALFRKVAT